jgi:uncharacterized integral membrane protein
MKHLLALLLLTVFAVPAAAQNARPVQVGDFSWTP